MATYQYMSSIYDSDPVMLPSNHSRPVANILDALINKPQNHREQITRTQTLSATEDLGVNIASEKLKRQNERIIQSDAALDGMVKKGRGGRANKWKPFDFHDSPDDDSADAYALSRHAALDVHAKIFQPTPPLHHASIDHAFGDYTHHRDYTRATQSQQDDFQLITGRRSRVSGLNAYQVREENRTPTVTATYNKREINDVFGNDLPSPSYCQSHPGTENGQIQFCIHPNGDVSAQQWFEAQYQWINVGQYSNIRKKTEGQLASDRLRGETEGQSLQQNTLAYFHAIAKQREAAVMDRPFGIKEIQACLPNLNIRPASNQERSHIATPPTSDSPTSSAAQLQPPVRYPVAVPNIRPLAFQERARSVFALASPPTSPTPLTKTQRPTLFFGVNPHSEDRYSNLTFGSMSKPATSLQDGGLSSRTYAYGTSYTDHGLPVTYGTSHHVRSQPSLSAISVPHIPMENRRQPGHARFAMKDILQKLPGSVSSRLSGTSSGTGGRTVMYDPLKDTPTPLGDRSDLENLFRQPYYNLSEGFPTREEWMEMDNHGDLNDLHESEPEAAETSHATSGHAYNNSLGCHNDTLLLKEPPTPQYLDEGSLSRNQPSVRNADYDANLHRWFTSGNKAERHEDFYQRILSYHTITEAFKGSVEPVRKADPGVIGPPSAARSRAVNTPSEQAGGKTLSYDAGITRLLIPVMENLASYVEGPMSKRHGYWAPFTPPPEWAIDKSLNGNNSFFDEDWGKPPERIGRDLRYRALGPYGRVGGGGERRQNSHGGEGGVGLISKDEWSPVAKRFA